jgi:hypothetical protein
VPEYRPNNGAQTAKEGIKAANEVIKNAKEGIKSKYEGTRSAKPTIRKGANDGIKTVTPTIQKETIDMIDTTRKKLEGTADKSKGGSRTASPMRKIAPVTPSTG